MNSSTSLTRRVPEQARSRRRVESILAATRSLIVDSGLEPVTMTDIAAEAGMGLTALYRYFPNKPSLIRELAVRLLEQDRSGLLQQLMDLDITANELLKLASSSYVQLHRDEPYRLSLRMAIQADSTLLAIDLEDSQNNAQLLAGRISQRTSVPDITTLERFLLMHMTLLNSTIQLMFQLDDEKEAEAVFEAFLTMAQRQLDTVL